MKILEQTGDQTLDLALNTAKIKKQALVFANTKRSAEKTAEDIGKSIKLSSPELDKIAEQCLNSLARPTKQCERLAYCIKKGVAFHHAGLTSKQKELIETNFKKGIIKIICCTPTLCITEDTMIWQGVKEKQVKEFKSSQPLLALFKNNEIKIMKAQEVNKLKNSSKIVSITSMLGYNIKLTPDHTVLIKKENRRKLLKAVECKRGDRIATIGKLNIEKTNNPPVKSFVVENKTPLQKIRFGPKLSYLIGSMLGDGYSGAERVNEKIKYKGSPCIVGIDEEIFAQIQEVCNKIRINYRKNKNYHGTPQLTLGKNKWFREFLCRCGVEKRDKKHISKKLMEMDLVNTSALLGGLFDTDGCVEKIGRVSFSNTSKILVEQIRKLLLRYEIVSRVRKREKGERRIYKKSYNTLPCYELSISHKKSMYLFYKKIGFSIKRKQEALIKIMKKLISNIHYVGCEKCNYRLYKDLLSGRIEVQKEWGKKKLKILKCLGERGELGSNELRKILNFTPRKKDRRLNRHYELISKRRVGSRSKTEWFWKLNKIGNWIYCNIIKENKDFKLFLEDIHSCPMCNNKIKKVIKKGWRDNDFEGEIFWDIIKKVEFLPQEKYVYDIVLPNDNLNKHLFVANGFLVHNSIGLDLPAFRTILKDLRRFSSRGLDWIPVLEFMQMAGRAGRPKYDKFGEAIAIANTPGTANEIRDRYLKGEPEPILSKLAVEPVLRTYLLSLIATNFVNTKKDIVEFFSKTFWAHHFQDMERLEEIIVKMLDLLEGYEFITPSSPDKDFVSASDINSEKYTATILGKRVAELYIDPLTAYSFVCNLRKALKKKNYNEFSFLQMVSHTLELRPLLRVKASEFEDIMEKYTGFEDNVLEDEPSTYEVEYEEFMSSIKTALMFLDWINEKSEEELLEKYNVRPGELKVKLGNADWLFYAAEEIGRIIKTQPLLKELAKVRFRLKYGVKEELITLLKLKGIGRVRARALFRNKIKTIADVKKADITKLVQILGKKTAIDIKKQVGIDLDKAKVPERKRKGQISLRDY